MSVEYFKRYFNPTATEIKAYQMGIADGLKKGNGRNNIVYDPSNEAKHHKQSIAAIEAARLLLSGKTPCKISIGVTENGTETQETDEIMLDSKFLALIILKGLSLKLRFEKHLENVRFNEDFSSAWIEYPKAETKDK